MCALLFTVIGCLTFPNRNGTCRSGECIRTANVLTMNMSNTSPAYKPAACMNFADYACGRFRRDTEIPTGRNVVMMTDNPRLEMDAKIAELLVGPNENNDPPALRRVRAAYQQCISQDQISSAMSFCVTAMKRQYPRAVIYLLVHALGIYEARTKVLHLLDNLKDSFIKKIEDSWLRRTGKAEAIKKIRSVRSLIFFTDDMLNPEILDQPDLERPVNVLGEHIEYDYTYHTIGVPIMAVYIPYYNYGLESMNAGALASVMAHELDHMFDSVGVPYDSRNQQSNWWTQWMQEQYWARAQRFIDQYNQFSDNGIRINGARSMVENIHDNVGFEVALHAYRSHARRQQKLTRFEDFSPEQLFTLAFASLHCDKFTVRGTQLIIDNHPYPPGSARINGVVMNSAEFSNIWNCLPNAAMNAPIKNNIWNKGYIPDHIYQSPPED